MKKVLSLIVLGLSLAAGVAYADPAADCAAKSAEMKLAGAAKASFEKKCVADAKAAAPAAAPAAGAASPACAKSADDKKLHGAARNSHIKKCMADEKAAAPAAPAK